MKPIKRANGHRFQGLAQPTPHEVDAALRPDPQDFSFKLEPALAAVLGLRSHVPDDAFTASTLGTERFGNGVLIDRDGLVVTIGYLVTEADAVVLVDASGREIEARVLGYDQETGFGLVRALAPVPAEPLDRGESTQLARDESVVIAAHGGMPQALAAQVAARREFAGYWEYLLDEAVFTVPAHPRWSGAALIGRDGRLHAIGSLFVQDAVPGDPPRSGNMLVPIELLEPILSDLCSGGRVRRPPRPWLGLFATELEDSLVVAGVIPGAPAARGGVKVGDLMLAVGGKPLRGLADFYRKLWAEGPAGTVVHFSIYRDGEMVEATVATASRYDFLKAPRRH